MSKGKRTALLKAVATMSKGKRTALLKAVATELKAKIRGKKTKWHVGDVDTLPGSTVCDPAEFAELFPGVAMTKKGVTTSFALTKSDLDTAFGDLNVKVTTWSQSHRAFRKVHKTDTEAVTLTRAEGKYSSSTSTLTIRFNVRVAGQSYDTFGGFGAYW